MECKECGEFKSIDEFSKAGVYSGRQRYRAQCKSCYRKIRTKNDPEVVKAYYGRNRERLLKHARKYQLKQYSLTFEDIESMLESQGNRCKICTIDFDKTGRGYQVDHCHETGKVRGLLC